MEKKIKKIKAERVGRFGLIFQKPIVASITLFLAVINSIIFPGLAILMQWITNSLIDNRKLEPLQILAGICFIFLALLVSAIYVWVKDRLINAVIKNEKNKIFIDIYKKNICEFRKTNTAVYSSILNQDIYIVENDYFETIFSVVGAISAVSTSLIIMWFIYYKVVFIILALVIAGVLLSNLIGIRMGKYKNEYLTCFGEFNRRTKDFFNAFELIKSYRIIGNILKTFEDLNQNLENKRLRSKLLEDTVALFSNFLAIFLGMAMFLICASYVSAGELRVGDMVAVVQLSNSIMSPIMMIIISLAQILSAKKVWTRIDEIKSYSTRNEAKKEGAISCSIPFNNSIAIKCVSYRYLGEVEEAVHNINIEFKKKKKYAIIGMSGSGKSTIIKLILRYFDDYSGAIYFDNHEYRDISDNSVYEHITYMQQHSVIFNDTLRNNLTLGEEISDESIYCAIQKTNLLDTVDRLTEGLDTVVNENGDNFSGGERKRIEICRALLRKSDIFIADEFATGLDNYTAKVLEKELVNLDATVINVTHYLDKENLKLYDELIVVDNGCVCERGSFDDLYLKGDILYKLIEKKG